MQNVRDTGGSKYGSRIYSVEWRLLCVCGSMTAHVGVGIALFYSAVFRDLGWGGRGRRPLERWMGDEAGGGGGGGVRG